MVEQEHAQIAFIDGANSKRDYCVVPQDIKIQSDLMCLLELEKQLSEDSLTLRQREGAILAHTFLWNNLPYQYKSELADLTAITS